MKVCLAGTYSREFLADEIKKSKYILESFWYFKDWQIPLLKSSDLFLIDSGAYTFMANTKSGVDWNDYLDRYIDFINKHDVQHFFELDIDNIVGYENVLKLRSKLERETGKQSIPVWHLNRGKAEFVKMCEEYDYVAVGGIVTKEIPTKQFIKYAPWFIKTARSYGTKIHGLGFTSLKELPNIHFDSVDSTSWLSGSRFGHVYSFDGYTIRTHTAPPGKKTVKYSNLDLHNLKAWIQFQDHADKYF